MALRITLSTALLATVTVIALGTPSLGAAADAGANAPPLFHVLIAHPVVRRRVEQALEGAAQRLAGSECQKVFAEFEDRTGQSLRATLDALHQTGAGFLTTLRFTEGETSLTCASVTSIAAFTQPGSHVVRVCGAVFARQYAMNPQAAEVIIIHELLHTLGLEENPPSSAEISRRVLVRCGPQNVQRKPI